jgi:foldase protein PrsA
LKRRDKRIRGLKALAVAVCVCAIGIWTSGCALVNVNPVRDRAQVIAVVNGKTVKKELFDNMMADTALAYASGGQSMPTGSELKTLKQETYDELIKNQVFAEQAKKLKLKVDEDAARKSGRKAYKALKKQADKKYATTLKTYYTNDKSFSAFMEDNAVTTAYAQKALNRYDKKLNKNPDHFLNQSVGSVEGAKVTYGQYYYQMLNQIMSAYASTGQAPSSDSATQKQLGRKALQAVNTERKWIAYCKKHNIKIKKADIDKQEKTLKTYTKQFFQSDSTLESFLSENYEGFTLSAYQKQQRQSAKGAAAQKAVKNQIYSSVKVTDSAMQGYYNKHIDTYSPATVSACHILTTNKKLAEKIYAQAKTIKTKSAFEKVMDQYKDNKKVSEAKDLGAFKSSDMVSNFSKAAFSANKNSVVGPVKTTYGYHIIFVYDKQKAGKDSWTKHKAALKAAIQKEKGQPEYKKLSTKMNKANRIRLNDPLQSASDLYAEKLKKSFNVKTYEKRI